MEVEYRLMGYFISSVNWKKSMCEGSSAGAGKEGRRHWEKRKQVTFIQFSFLQLQSIYCL